MYISLRELYLITSFISIIILRYTCLSCYNYHTTQMLGDSIEDKKTSKIRPSSGRCRMHFYKSLVIAFPISYLGRAGTLLYCLTSCLQRGQISPARQLLLKKI